MTPDRPSRGRLLGLFPPEMTGEEILMQVKEVIAMGDVQYAVQGRIGEGQTLHTPTRRQPFRVGRIDSTGVVLLLGRKEAHTLLTWGCLEGVIPYLRRHGGEAEIGGRYDTAPHEGTLDEYLKGFVNRATAGWVAALLEAAGMVEIVREHPARVKLCC